MALERSSAGPLPANMSPVGAEVGARPFGVSSAALQRYNEAVFRVTNDGYVEPANPIATELAARFSSEDVQKLSTAATKSKSNDRAIVDMVDIGCGEKQQNLQV